MGPERAPSPLGEGAHHSAARDVPETVITSRKNPVIQDLRALLRSSARRTARCVVEGWHFLETAAQGGAECLLLVHTPAAAADPRTREVRRRLHAAGARVVVVSPYVFDALTQVETPQGVLGVVRRPPAASPAMLGDPQGLLVVLDGVQDPGNVGAVLRTAAAAGVTGGAIVGEGADPYGPKAIRASAGTVFGLPLLFYEAANEAAAALHEHGVRVLIADPRGERLDSEVAYTRPLALVFGGERAGPSPAWRRHGTSVRLPMAGAAESLGVAAAAAVLLYRAAHPAGRGGP